MKPGRASFRGTIWALFYVLLLCLAAGCSRSEELPSESKERPTATPSNRTRPSISPEDLFGTYVITEYARFCDGRSPEADAKKQIGTQLVVSKEVFSMRDILIRVPQYKIRYYEPLIEGEVPQGARRRLSSFYGFGSERDGVTVLEVHKSGNGGQLARRLEVIDGDTLWDAGYSASWLYQFRRIGARNRARPLKEQSPFYNKE